jgi:hypothetical protein
MRRSGEDSERSGLLRKDKGRMGLVVHQQKQGTKKGSRNSGRLSTEQEQAMQAMQAMQCRVVGARLRCKVAGDALNSVLKRCQEQISSHLNGGRGVTVTAGFRI